MDVRVELEKCTGCRHCFDVCPVNIFVMHPRGEFPQVIDDAEVAAKISVPPGEVCGRAWPSLYYL